MTVYLRTYMKKASLEAFSNYINYPINITKVLFLKTLKKLY